MGGGGGLASEQRGIGILARASSDANEAALAACEAAATIPPPMLPPAAHDAPAPPIGSAPPPANLMQAAVQAAAAPPMSAGMPRQMGFDASRQQQLMTHPPSMYGAVDYHHSVPGCPPPWGVMAMPPPTMEAIPLPGAPQHMPGVPQHMQGAPQYMQGMPQHMPGAPQHMQGAPQHMQGAPQHMQGAPQHMQGAPQHMQIQVGLTPGPAACPPGAMPSIQTAMPLGHDPTLPMSQGRDLAREAALAAAQPTQQTPAVGQQSMPPMQAAGTFQYAPQ